MTPKQNIANSLFRIAVLARANDLTKEVVNNLDRQATEFAPKVCYMGRLERKLHKLYERMCNEEESDKLTAAVDKTETRTHQFAVNAGFTLVIQRDQRGGAIRSLKIPALTGEKDLTDLLY